MCCQLPLESHEYDMKTKVYKIITIVNFVRSSNHSLYDYRFTVRINVLISGMNVGVYPSLTDPAQRTVYHLFWQNTCIELVTVWPKVVCYVCFVYGLSKVISK